MNRTLAIPEVYPPGASASGVPGVGFEPTRPLWSRGV
jgi:hypothetical protein